jgi:hypothetical protein
VPAPVHHPYQIKSAASGTQSSCAKGMGSSCLTSVRVVLRDAVDPLGIFGIFLD